MWNEEKQSRLNALREADRNGTLFTAERSELDALLGELDELERAYLGPGTAQVKQEREKLEAQNTELEVLLQERRAYVAEARNALARLEGREGDWHRRPLVTVSPYRAQFGKRRLGALRGRMTILGDIVHTDLADEANDF